MKRILISLILIITVFTLAGCGNKAVKKAIEDGKAAFEQQEYEEALALFKTAIDKNTKDEEVKKLYNIIDTYLNSKELYEGKKYSEANTLLEDLKIDYTSYIISEDIDELKGKIENNLTYIEDSDKLIEKVGKHITAKDLEEGKDIIDLLEKRDLTEEQKEKVENLKISLNVLINEKTEENIKNEVIEEVDKETINDDKNESVNEEDLTGSLNEEKAIKLVKKYLMDNGEYIPSIIAVDGEDDKEYRIHCYDIIDDGNGKSHTATSGWYYVNKSSEEVTSMF